VTLSTRQPQPVGSQLWAYEPMTGWSCP